MNYFASNIQILRKAKGLKQDEFELLIGIKRTTWNNWETDKSEPDISNILLLAAFFEVSTNKLLGEDLSKDAYLMEKAGSFKKTVKSIPNGIPNGIPNEGKMSIVEEPKPTYGLPKSDLNKDDVIASQRETIETLKATIAAKEEIIELLKNNKKEG